MSDERVRASLVERNLGGVGRVWAALKRPAEMVEGTRWLFWLLAMISLGLSALAALAQGWGPMTPVAVAATAVLTLSLTVGYLNRRGSWVLDLVDAGAILALACSTPTPAAVFAVVFAMVWFRSLSGSTGGAVLRCLLYAGMMILSLPLVSLVPGGGPADAPLILTCLPPMLVNVVLSRHLFKILRNIEQGARRDAIHAATGSRLLGITDPDEISGITLQAVSDICSATPGLRAIGVRPVGDGLEVGFRAGPLTDEPITLSAQTRSALEASGYDAPGITGLDDLDAAVGSVCVWQSLQAPEPQVKGWLVVGAQRRLPTQAVDTLIGVVSLSVLALRNSRTHQELTEQATLDSLTGLANRKLFNTALAKTFTHAAGAAAETAVLFVDLDDFKHVNDTLGHSAGDELLREVAARITSATRSGDLCARLGGDEFAVLLRHTGAEEATQIARRIVDAVGGPVELAEGVAQVGASVGLAVQVSGTPEELVRRADIAMYAAKAGGKGRMQVYTEGLLRDDAGRHVGEATLEATTSNSDLVMRS